MSNNIMRWLTLILSILVLICGISLLFAPLEAYIMIAVFIPIAILFHGISCFIQYSREHETHQLSEWLLADGIISTIIGVIFLFRTDTIAAALPYIFGFWVMFAGVLRIVGALSTRKVIPKQGWLLVWGAVGVLSGIVLLYHPLFAGAVITYFVIWALIFMGAQGIFSFFVLNSVPGDGGGDKPGDGDESGDSGGDESGDKA